MSDEANPLDRPEVSLDLREKTPLRKGYFLLIPWMLLGTMWLSVNTTLDSRVVTFYNQLLTAGTLSLLVLVYVNPKFGNELTQLKLLPFVTFYAVLCCGVMFCFMFGTVFLQGNLSSPTIMPEVLAEKIALTILLVAPVETIVFQYIVPKIAYMSLTTIGLGKVAGVLSQLTFGAFHFAAYGGNISAMISATALGVIFYALVGSNPKWGLGAAMGAHAGWNISVIILNLTVISGWLNLF